MFTFFIHCSVFILQFSTDIYAFLCLPVESVGVTAFPVPTAATAATAAAAGARAARGPPEQSPHPVSSPFFFVFKGKICLVLFSKFKFPV
jgi:hypothetical protein